MRGRRHCGPACIPEGQVSVCPYFDVPFFPPPRLFTKTMASGLGVPVKLLHESLGHIITVELKTGQLYRGKLLEGPAPRHATCARSRAQPRTRSTSRSRTSPSRAATGASRSWTRSTSAGAWSASSSSPICCRMHPCA